MIHEKQKHTGESIVRNVFYLALTWVLPLGLNLVATPVILGALGHVDYGIYVLVLGFIGYSFTFNLGRAIAKYVAEYSITGESEKIQGIISASLFLSLATGTVGVIVMWLIGGWLVSDVFQLEVATRERTVTALYIAVGVIILWGVNQVFSAVLQGLHRFDVYSKITTANSILMASGSLILAYFGFGLVDLLVWYAAAIFMSCVLFAVAAKKLLPELQIKLTFSREAMMSVIRYSGWVVASQIFGNVLVIFERGWITWRFGPETLTYYVVTLTFGVYLQMFIGSLALVILPLASELQKEGDKLLRLYVKATKVITIFIVFVGTTVYVHSSQFLTLWIGADFAREASALLVMHIICFSFVSILTVSTLMCEGLGYPKWNAGRALLSTTAAIAITIVVGTTYGSQGIAVARIIGFFLVFLTIFQVERAILGAVQTRFWAALALNLTAAAVVSGLAQTISGFYMPISWFSFAGTVAIGAILYFAVLWMLNFVTADEKLLVKRLLGAKTV